MKKRPVRGWITRETILKNAEDCLRQSRQWLEHADGEGGLGFALEYQNRAKALIELLEVDDCGSVGGFDRRRGQPEERSLRKRLEWLKSLQIEVLT